MSTLSLLASQQKHNKAVPSTGQYEEQQDGEDSDVICQ